MRMPRTVVRFRHAALERPVVVVEEQRGDTVIRLRPWGDEHLTLHRQDDGILLTHRSSHKPRSVWDEDRIAAARACGYKDPERHGDYYQHRRLVLMSNIEGYRLVGGSIDIKAASERSKYEDATSIVIDAPAQKFMLNVWLTTPRQELPRDEPRVETPFGALYFRSEPLREERDSNRRA